MAYSLNNVVVIGRLTFEPNTKQVGTGLTEFSIAVHDGKYAQTGKDRAAFITCKAWGKTSEIASQYHKGDMVSVEGKISQDKWESNDGQQRSKLYITAYKVILLKERGVK